MTYSGFDLIGTLGVGLVLGAYILLQLQKIESTALSYSVVNAFGALFILISLSNDFNFSAFLIEAAWLIISVVGIFLYLIRKRATNNSSTTEKGNEQN